MALDTDLTTTETPAWAASNFPPHTAVGATAIPRFLRPVRYQNAPQNLLPAARRDRNELGILRRFDGRLTTADVHWQEAP